MGIEPTHIGITTRGLTTWRQTPYRNTLVGNDLETYLPTDTKASNVFLYGRGDEIRTHDDDFKDRCLRPLGDTPIIKQDTYFSIRR